MQFEAWSVISRSIAAPCPLDTLASNEKIRGLRSQNKKKPVLVESPPTETLYETSTRRGRIGESLAQAITSSHYYCTYFHR